MKAIFREIRNWIVAACIACMIINVLMMFYYRSPGRISTGYGVTGTLWYPDRYVLNSKEGFSIRMTDANGFLNTTTELKEEYVLVTGSSHTAGREVPLEYRFSDILNIELGGSADKLAVYNTAQDGFTFPGVLKGFKALTEEFPDSYAVVIEMGYAEYSIDELQDSLQQREYRADECGNYRLHHLTSSERIRCNILSYLPITSNIVLQLQAISNVSGQGMQSKAYDNSEEEFEEIIDQAIAMVRSEYKGKIIIAYHPVCKIASCII